VEVEDMEMIVKVEAAEVEGMETIVRVAVEAEDTETIAVVVVR
jgi:hypothetical protein